MALGIQNGDSGAVTRAMLNALLTSSADVFGQGGQTVVALAAGYFVDSRRGNDANSGLSQSAPKRTIAAIQALAGSVAGAVIWLARGSSWREMLSLTGDDQNVGHYGLLSDPRPSLRADNPVPSGLFTVAGGQTYTYQTTIALPNLAGKQWVNAWEAGMPLVFVADIATCESTPGSYFVSTQTNSGGTVSGASATLYIHPAANGDPRVNGILYEYTTRAFGLTSTGARLTVHGVETKRNCGHDGSMVLYGADNLVYDCAAIEGSKHNMYVGSGVVDSCYIAEQYYGTSSADLLVFFGSSVTGKSWTVQKSTLKRTAYNAAGVVNAVYSHTSATNYATGTVQDNTIINCTNGFNGTVGGPADVTFRRNVLTGCSKAMAYSPTGALDVSSNRFTSSAVNAVFIDLQTPLTSANVENNQVWIYDPFIIISIAPSSGAPNVTIKNNILYVGNQSASAPSTPVYMTRGNLVMTGNVFDSAGNWSGKVIEVTCTTFTADANIYAGAAGGQYAVVINGAALGGGTLSGNAAYKAAANAIGQELTSTTAPSGSYAYAVQ